MADAYEVGIELALQDGVSAGLETVAKELAALDAAVAASSAGLMALIRTAGMAAEAVALVGGARIRVPVAEPERRGTERPAEAPAGGPVQGGPRGGDGVAPQRVEAAREEGVVVPAAPGARTAVAAERQLAATVPAQVPVQAPPTVVERRPTVTPVAIVRADGPAAGQDGFVPAVRPEPGGVPAPVRVLQERGFEASSAPLPTPAPVREAVAAGVIRPGPAMGADVARALPRRGAAADGRAARRDVALPTAASQGEMVVGQAAARAVEPRGDAAAPAPRREESGTGERPGLTVSRGERAVAPVRMSGGSGGGGGGTVLLDGRLVGEWLVERMARDAARPGAGMTSFDARQAPAWTPAGGV